MVGNFQINTSQLLSSRWEIFLLVLAFSKTVLGSASALKNRWNLPDEPAPFEFSDEDGTGFEFLFEFPVSRDVATERNIAVSLFDRGCKYNDGNPPVELVEGTSEELIFPPSMSTSTAPTVMTGVEVNLGVNELNVAGLLQEYPSIWDEEKSQVSFCVRFSLMADTIEVNFVETVVILDVLLDGLMFEILDANAAPKEKIESIQQVSYTVKAYLCDNNYRPLREKDNEVVDLLYEVCDRESGETEISSTTREIDSSIQQLLSDAQKTGPDNIIYRQGSIVRVCIRPDDTALGEVSMKTIEEMVFEGTVDSGIAKKMYANGPTTFLNEEMGTYTQVAVQNGSTRVSNGLSVMSCANNRLENRPDVVVCAVDTLLVADFYWRPHGNVAKVRAYGSAVLQFGKDVNRLRRMEMANDIVSYHDPERSLRYVPLDTYWNMTRPVVDFPGIEEATGGFDFRMKYTVSDAISSDMTRMEIWDRKCQQMGNDPELEYDFDTESASDLLEVTSSEAYTTGEGWGSQTITINGEWKRGTPEFSSLLLDSPYYQETSDRSLVQISLCARYQLHTRPQVGSIEVNFLETPIIINIDMSSKIEFSVNLDLVHMEDPCIEELDDRIRKMSGGREGINDLFMSSIYTQPGSDPGMFGSTSLTSSSSSGTNSASSMNQIYKNRGISSADPSRKTWTFLTIIGMVSIVVLAAI